MAFPTTILEVFAKSIAIALLVVCGIICRAHSMEALPPKGTYVEGELLIAYKDSGMSLSTLSKSIGMPIHSIKRLERFNCEHVVLPQGLTVKKAISEFSKLPGVRYCEPNYLYELHKTPDDPEFIRLWGLEKIGAPAAWDHITGSENIVVGVLDSGIHYDHPDIAPNVWKNLKEIPNNGIDDDNNGYVDDVMGIDLVEDDSDPLDDSGHGSHVSGIIGAVSNNNSGVAGVNWQVKIMALRISSADGFVALDRIVRALEYIVVMKERGVNIRAINASWGGPSPSRTLHDVFSQVSDAAILIVCSSGNSTDNNDFLPIFPASYDIDGIISVAASTEEDGMASFSNYGPQTVDLAAPGTTILSLHKDANSLAYQHGTSMAAPHVAGAAALLSSFDSSLSMATLKSVILGSIDQISGMENFIASGGRLNVANAIEFLGSDSGVDLIFGSSPSEITSGRDIYLSSIDQKVAGVASIDNIATYYFKLENDGENQNSFMVNTDAQSYEGWSIRFYDAWEDGNDITDQVTHNGWDVIDLPPEEFKPFRVEVVPVGVDLAQDSLSFIITGQTISNAHIFDEVKIIVRSKSVPPGIHQVNKDVTGKSSIGASFNTAISANGRFVVFDSDASNLVPNDNNEVQIFLCVIYS